MTLEAAAASDTVVASGPGFDCATWKHQMNDFSGNANLGRRLRDMIRHNFLPTSAHNVHGLGGGTYWKSQVSLRDLRLERLWQVRLLQPSTLSVPYSFCVLMDGTPSHLFVSLLQVFHSHIDS